jgi:TPR repeat protein
MPTVKQLFETLSAEERRALALDFFGYAGETGKDKAFMKIYHLLNEHNLACTDKVKEYVDLLMDDIGPHLMKMMSGREHEIEMSGREHEIFAELKQKHGGGDVSKVEKEEGTKQINEYFETLSHQQRRTVAKDLSSGASGDKQKMNKALGKLWNFDGDHMENTKLFTELVGSLEYRQKECIEMKEEGENKEREFISAEKKRVEDVVRRHKELHPPRMSECPVCLEDIEMTEHNSMVYFYCCGQGTCFSCCKKNNDSHGEHFHGKCPLCRGDIVTDYKRIKKWAEKGYSWAQMKMAGYYFTGCQEGLIPIDKKKTIDKKKAIEWLKLSCENESPDLDAIYTLAKEYEYGKNVEKSKEKAIALMKKAADMGSRRAQDSVVIYLGEKHNLILADSVYYATLAIAERPPSYLCGASPHSAFVLGNAFNDGVGGLEQNIFLARHYLSIAVQGNKDAIDPRVEFKDGYERAYWYYADALLYQGVEVFGEGNMSVPGFSPVPKAMYWFHKAHTMAVACACGNPKCWKELLKVRAKHMMGVIKSGESKKCSYCFKKAEDCPGGTLKNCARCSGAWYCGRDCQVAAWKAGHKLDCVKLNGPADAALH